MSGINVSVAICQLATCEFSAFERHGYASTVRAVRHRKLAIQNTCS